MSAPEGGRPYLRGTFQQTCGFCGCVFRVEVPGQIGNEGPATYRCPECHKPFPVRASGSPAITLISKRTDGRRKRYPTGE
ncbi:MAG: hypothetical protein ACE5LB_03425 [Acidiferrobacterales bacterium]